MSPFPTGPLYFEPHPYHAGGAMRARELLRPFTRFQEEKVGPVFSLEVSHFTLTAWVAPPPRPAWSTRVRFSSLSVRSAPSMCSLWECCWKLSKGVQGKVVIDTTHHLRVLTVKMRAKYWDADVT